MPPSSETCIKIAKALRDFNGKDELLRWVAHDFALGQRFLEFSNLSLGKVGVTTGMQHR